MKLFFNKPYFPLLTTAVILLAGVFPYKGQAYGDVAPFQGAKMAAMAGVGAAIPFDATSGNLNPALMARIGNVISFHPGLYIEDHSFDYVYPFVPNFPPGRDIRALGPQKDRRRVLPVLFAGANYVINNQWSFGSSLTGIFSISRYDNNVLIPTTPALAPALPRMPGSGAGNTYFTLITPELNNTIAYKPDERQAYALDVILAYKYLQTNARTRNGIGPLSRNSGKGDSAFGAGLKVGGYWKVSSCLDFGLAVGTPIFFQHLKAYSDFLPFAPNEAWNGVIGIAWHVQQATTVAFDIEGELLGRVSAYGKSPLEGGFGLKNAVNYKIGIQHKFTPFFAARFGYNYGKTPIQKSTVYYNPFIDSTAYSEHMIGTGFTYSVTRKIDFDLAVNYFFKNAIIDDGSLSISPTFPQGGTKDLKSAGQTFSVLVGFNYKY